MPEHEYTTSAAAVNELLAGDGHFAPPERLLRDLTEEQATAVPPGSPYSIAQVLAHMQFCQQGEIAGVLGEEWPDPPHLDDTFAPIRPGTWPQLVEQFLAGIEACGRLAEERGGRTSAQRDDTSVSYDLAGTALHNAYHFGQIVLLRRMQGLWPPAGGDPNDY